jgi:hypothetical protein
MGVLTAVILTSLLIRPFHVRYLPLMIGNMRRNSKIQTVIIWLATALLSALAQTARPQNVKDYFYALPEKFFESQKNKTANWMLSNRESVVDLNNGYLFAQGDGAQPSIWICLFKKPDGNHLVAVQTTAGDTDEITYLYFYLYEQGKWRDVTKQTLPAKHNQQYRYKYNLPRYGRRIEVTTPTGKKLYDWEWHREKFIVKK